MSKSPNTTQEMTEQQRAALDRLYAARKLYDRARDELRQATVGAVLAFGKMELVTKDDGQEPFERRLLLELPSDVWTQDRNISSDAIEADAVDSNLAAYEKKHMSGLVCFDDSEQASFEGSENVIELAYAIMQQYK